MSEFRYVCMVESIIFTSVLTLLLAFRFDIFKWNADETWPVFSTACLLTLLYTYVFLIPCVILYAKQMSNDFKDVLLTGIQITLKLLVVIISLIFHIALHAILIHSADRQLFLCQLLATECNVNSEQVWSSTHTFVYGAFVIPISLFTIGLLTHVAFSFELTRPNITWTLCMNLVYLILTHVFLTLEYNNDIACEDVCKSPITSASNVTVFDTKPKAEIVTFFQVTIPAVVFVVTDILYLFYVDMHPATDAHIQKQCLKTGIYRVLQLASQIVYTLLRQIPIPLTNLCAHIGLYMCCTVLDLVNIFYSERNSQQPDVQVIVPAQPLQPFAFDNTKRLRLNLNNRNLWSGAETRLQATQHEVHSKKIK